MAAEVSDCLDPSTKELFCCLTGRCGSIQIPWMTMTQKQQLIQRESSSIKGVRHSGYILSWGEEIRDGDKLREREKKLVDKIRKLNKDKGRGRKEDVL